MGRHDGGRRNGATALLVESPHVIVNTSNRCVSGQKGVSAMGWIWAPAVVGPADPGAGRLGRGRTPAMRRRDVGAGAPSDPGRVAAVAGEVAVQLLDRRPSVTACTSRPPPTNAPFQDAPRPPNGSSRSPRERGLLMPTLNAWMCSASSPASRLRRRRRCWRPARRWRRSSRPAARPRCRPRRSCRPGRTAPRASAGSRRAGPAARPAPRRPRCPARRGTGPGRALPR